MQPLFFIIKRYLKFNNHIKSRYYKYSVIPAQFSLPLIYILLSKLSVYKINLLRLSSIFSRML